jgi:hypothetical protein
VKLYKYLNVVALARITVSVRSSHFNIYYTTDWKRLNTGSFTELGSSYSIVFHGRHGCSTFKSEIFIKFFVNISYRLKVFSSYSG